MNQKNPEGMLPAFSIVKKKRDDFVLKIIGPANRKVQKNSRELSLKKQIVFMNEIPYAEVANEISRSDAMIHFTVMKLLVA